MMLNRLVRASPTIQSTFRLFNRTQMIRDAFPETQIHRLEASLIKPVHMMLSTDVGSPNQVDRSQTVGQNRARQEYESDTNSHNRDSCRRMCRRHDDEYEKVIQDLNSLQSNAKTISLAKYKSPQDILPLFSKQLKLAGINIDDLNKLKIIHISGTKGKGSSCAFVEAILRAHGLKTGFYNSPHLVKVTERIRINGKQIDDASFCKYFHQIFHRLSEGTKNNDMTMPTYFSFLTILAFHVFIEERVDCAVIEVGIGGEYDPTNIIQKPIACGISSIHYDHINILGDSIESIAWSKAGIAKRGAPVFTVDQEHEAALKVIRTRAREKSCPVYICRALNNSTSSCLGIKGPVQKTNASLAIQIAEYFLKCNEHSECKPTNETVDSVRILETEFTDLSREFQNALTECSWSGRCQVLKYPGFVFFLDGAHTKESMDNCVEWFLKSSEEEDPTATRILMVNIIGERDKSQILRPLCGSECRFDEVIFSTNRTGLSADGPKSECYAKDNSDKGMNNVQCNADIWKSLTIECNKSAQCPRIFSNTSESVEYVKDMSDFNPGKKYHVLVTGSLHFVGAVLETLTEIDSLAG